MAPSNASLSIATAAVVAQRLADLLQCFPSAAIEGVQWHTLARKYEERYATPLSLKELGHDTALAAAAALLWDVVRVAEADDTDNPVVAIEDAIALTPLPGSLACWPSLYQTLCQIVQNHGTPEKQVDAEEGMITNTILLSQVKPLLQRHWHSAFDDNGLSYFTGEGTVVKLKKMKHLLQALLRWREQRVEWRSTKEASRAKSSAVDEAVHMKLEFVPSKTKNDLLLRCVCSRNKIEGPEVCAAPCLEKSPSLPDYANRTEDTSTAEPCSRPLSPCSQGSSHRSFDSAKSDLQQELERLRSENARLRNDNSLLEQLRPNLFDIQLKPQHEAREQYGYDDPFEPPDMSMWETSPSSFRSGSATPRSLSEFSMSTSCIPSGYATPVLASSEHFSQPVGQICNGVTLVPVWFQQIPSGVVQQARTMFERHTWNPRIFAQQMQ
jgi:hypothetical protein